MKKSVYFASSILCGILLISSCHKELYDSTALGKDYFIQDIPEDFNWSMTSSSSLEVVPYDLYNGQYDYTIEVFNKNPLTNKNATLYAIGWGTTTQPFQKTITIPSVDTLLYIRQTSPDNRYLVKAIHTSGRELICNFNPSGETASTSLLTKAMYDDVAPSEVPADAITIEGNQPVSLKKGKNYVITGTFSQAITFPAESDGVCNLYITGTWNIPSTYVNFPRNCNLYIMNQGQLSAQTPCNLNWESYEGGLILVAPGGQIGKEDLRNISFTWQGAVQMTNYGTIYCDKINIYAYNKALIHNKGLLYANEIICNNNPYTFKNECYANIKTHNVYNGTVTIAPECSWICETLRICGSNITLGNESILRATNIVVPDYGNNLLTGSGTKYALIRCNGITKGSNPSIQLSGNLYLGFKNVSDQDYKLTSSNIVMEDVESGASIEIKPSKCNEGNEYNPENPRPPEFPKTITYTQAYTYASEDNYPSPGDFDLNDLVLSMDSVAYRYPEKDKISELTWFLTLRAVGATHQLGAAIQLDNLVPDAVQQASYSKTMPSTSFYLNSNQTERDQDHAVIPLFDNAHQVLGLTNTTTLINTINEADASRVSPCSFQVTVKFATPIDEKLVKDNYNYFIIVGNRSKDRTEIHLPQYTHTNLSYASKEFQDVTKKFMWTIQVPGIFKYSQERTSIKETYPNFEKWVSSDRTENEDWYLHYDGNLIYKD